MECGREAGQGKGVDNAAGVADANEARARRVRVDVTFVDIIGDDARDGNELGRHCARHGHEDQQQRCGRAAFAQECDGRIGQHQSRRDIGCRHARRIGRKDRVGFERQRREAHCCCAEPGYGKPGQAA